MSEQGERGRQGSAGETGAVGRTGDAGVAGRAGEAGQTGRAGDAGHAGATGDQGVQGYRGLMGYPGNQGNQGFEGGTGIKGETGARGATGKAGADAVLIGRRALTIMAVTLLIFVGGVGSVLSIVAIQNSKSIERIESVRGDVIARVQETDRINCEAENVVRGINRGVFEKRLEDDPGGPKFEKKLREAVVKLKERKCENLPALKIKPNKPDRKKL